MQKLFIIAIILITIQGCCPPIRPVPKYIMTAVETEGEWTFVGRFEMR